MQLCIDKNHFLLGSVSIGFLCGLVGYFLMMKKLSSLADGIGHAFFGVNGIAILFGIHPFLTFFLVVLTVVVFFINNSSKRRGYGDSLVMSLSSFFFAFGLFIYDLKPELKAKVEKVFLGSLTEMKLTDSITVGCLAAFTIFLLIKKYNVIVAFMFDGENNVLSRQKVKLYNIFFLLYSTFIVTICTKYSGSLLISGITVLPTLISQKLAKNFKQAILLSAIVPAFISILSLFLSFSYSLNLSVINILLLGSVFIFSSILSKK